MAVLRFNSVNCLIMYYVSRILGFLRTIAGVGMWKRNSYNLTSVSKRLILFPFWYVLALVFRILDLLLLGELISLILVSTSRTKRRLTALELSKLEVLGQKERSFLETVIVIENSWLSKLGCRLTRSESLGLGVARTVCFSRTIDTGRSSDMGWLVHELAHALQFKYRGLIYIPEALVAQHFSGYDFGGQKSLSEQRLLIAFNPEQQAEIFRQMMLSDYPSELREEIIKGKW